MDDRVNLPVTLPSSNPTISYWQDPPDPEIADYASSGEFPAAADTVIIGSGITGACTAFNLLQKPDHGKLVMLEARQACSGATGRNGGHTKAGSYRSFLDHTASLGLDVAIKLARFEYANLKSVHAFALEHDIDCDLFSGDTVDIIYDHAQWDTALKAVEAIRDAMPNELDTVARYKFWSAEEARDVFHCKGEDMFGAVSYEAGSLSAYKFVIGVLKLCLKAGMSLFTNTPALKISQGEDKIWNVSTSKGLIRAKRVVLATNGYTGFLSERFRKSIVPVRGQITVHRPGQDMPSEGLPTTYSFIYSNGFEYMVPRRKGTKFAGDIVMGGGLVKGFNEGLEEFGTMDDASINSDISEYLTATTTRYFGSSWGRDHPDGRIRREWTGVMGFSPDGFPFVGKVPGEEELWIAASFQGHGMVLCFLCAKALVEMMDGEKKELSEWFPDVFRVREERFGKRFLGISHLALAKESEVEER